MAKGAEPLCTQRPMANARTAVADVIVLDQFLRNNFRGKPCALAGDAMAFTIAVRAVSKGIF